MREDGALAHDCETMKICVRAYLDYVRAIETTLSDIAEDIERIEARLELLGVSYDSVGSGSGGRDALQDGVVKASELRDEWAGAMARHADDLAKAKLLCRPVHECRYVLWMHAVDRLTWGETARKVGYSVAQTRRMADVGMRELYYLMPEQWRRDPIPNAMPR